VGQTGSLNPLTGCAENAARRPVWIRWIVFVVIALLGLAVRLPQLGARPMHTDEAVNAYIVGQLLAGHSYTYDAKDRHGPALAALTLPLVRMQGAKAFADLTEAELRLTDVVAGTVTILLFGAGMDMFGFAPCVIAALLFAFAPLPVYYDRYFIHESLFVAATFGLILAGWRAWRDSSAVQALLAGACAALMLACKETAVLHFCAMAVAAMVFWLWNLRGKLRGGLQQTVVLIAAAVFLLLSVMLFTWFGSNWQALVVLLHAGPGMLARAGGEGHEKPFWYFGKLLTGGWSGGLISALACVGLILRVSKRDDSPFGFLGLYAGIVAVIYSMIPYKTPWLALNFWLPVALFAGLTLKWLWDMPARYPAVRVPIRASCVMLGIAAAVLIAHDTRERVFVHPADESNPFAYAHTSEDLLGLPEAIADVARQDGLSSPRIAVIASDPWPLPWYLRHYAQVGFWQPGQKVGQADFYITSTDAADQYSAQLKDLRPEFFGVRPGVLILLWEPAPK
jgi:uncharacterized protein (TIGR03663 family)